MYRDIIPKQLPEKPCDGMNVIAGVQIVFKFSFAATAMRAPSGRSRESETQRESSGLGRCGGSRAATRQCDIEGASARVARARRSDALALRNSDWSRQK